MRTATPPGFDLNDLFTHREAWRSAIVAVLETSGIGEADESYWRHELAVFDRTFSIFGGDAPPAADPDAWTEWAGGDEPPADATGKVVDVRFRGGGEGVGPAAVYNWGRYPTEIDGEGDIVAYRIAAEQPEA